jgi:hypothetical protein
MLLGIAGAMNGTISKKVLGRRFDLLLPHLVAGNVMFNKNPHTVTVHEYAGRDGVRHDLADLVETPALGYRHARVALDLMAQPDYLLEICFLAYSSRHEELTFYESEYQVDVDPRTPSRTTSFRCDAHGITPR